LIVWPNILAVMSANFWVADMIANAQLCSTKNSACKDCPTPLLRQKMHGLTLSKIIYIPKRPTQQYPSLNEQETKS
jgi:hypothetical protein